METNYVVILSGLVNNPPQTGGGNNALPLLICFALLAVGGGLCAWDLWLLFVESKHPYKYDKVFYRSPIPPPILSKKQSDEPLKSNE